MAQLARHSQLVRELRRSKSENNEKKTGSEKLTTVND